MYGDAGAATFCRSILKPFQALPLVEDGAAAAYGFGSEQLALACASHGGRPEHVTGVAAILRGIGLDENALHCGPQTPYDDEAARAIECSGDAPGRLHNNCSGKHAALLALAAHHGWEADGYWRYDHPVQRRLREHLASWIGPSPETLLWETDGCGLPTPYLALDEMARAYARLGAKAAAGDPGPAAVVAAMTEHPELTSSPGREPLVIMRATRGRLLAKEGAEGVLCVAAPPEGWGLALKIEDGARRGVGPAAAAVLDTLGLLANGEAEALESLARPPILSTTGEPVGLIRAVAAVPGSAPGRA